MGVRSIGISSAVSLVGFLGCATATGDLENAEGPDQLPETDVDSIASQAKVTTVNSDGTWTGNAARPGQTSLTPPLKMLAWADFTGPAGKTRKMGMCGLREASTSALSYVQNPKTCNVVADCATSPAAPPTLPTGGTRYCVAPDGVGQKYCYYRPGAAATYCGGTPVTGVASAPGTIYSPFFGVSVDHKWISYACFEGCAATDPSSSSAHTVVVSHPPKK